MEIYYRALLVDIHYRALLIGALSFSALPTIAAAESPMPSYETEVIHKGRFSKPITDYVNTEGKDVMQEQIAGQNEIRRQLDAIIATANKQDVSSDLLGSIFPVTPEFIKRIVLPGTTITKDMPELPRPLFIIGNDKFSMQWLNANKAELERFQAAGIITKVDSQQEFEAIQEAVSPLPLMPMSADALAEEMGVPGYPIMITGRGFFQ